MDQPVSTEPLTPSEPTPVPTESPAPPSPWIGVLRRVVLLIIAFALARGMLGVLRQASLESLLSQEHGPRLSPNIEAVDWLHSWSVAGGRPVAEVVEERAALSLILLAAALSLAVILALIAAFVAVALHWLQVRSPVIGTILKVPSRAWVLGWASAPIFWLGLMAIIVFAIIFEQWNLPTLPPGGAISVRGEDAGSPADRFAHLILPATVLAIYPASLAAQAGAHIATRSHSSQSTRILDGILTGASALFRQVGGVLGFLVLTETVFAYPGVGHLLFMAIYRLDLPIIFGVAAAMTVWILVARLLGDALRELVSRRERDSASGEAPPESTPPAARRAWVVVALTLLIVPLLMWTFGAVAWEAALTPKPEDRHLGSSSEHPLGTDEVGRDVWARILMGTRNSVGKAAIAGLLTVIPAALLGVAVVFLRRRWTILGDTLADLLLLPADVLKFIPLVVFLMLALLPTGPESGGRLWLIAPAALAARAVPAVATLWDSRQPVRQSVRWMAGLGALFLANVFVALQVLASLDFLGLGASPPFASLGNMLTSIQDYRFVNPSLAIWPGLVLWLSALIIYLAADALLGYFPSKELMARLNE